MPRLRPLRRVLAGQEAHPAGRRQSDVGQGNSCGRPHVKTTAVCMCTHPEPLAARVPGQAMNRKPTCGSAGPVPHMKRTDCRGVRQGRRTGRRNGSQGLACGRGGGAAGRDVWAGGLAQPNRDCGQGRERGGGDRGVRHPPPSRGRFARRGSRRRQGRRSLDLGRFDA